MAKQKEIIPFHNMVLFRRLEPDRTLAGLHLPQNAEGMVRCIVISQGPGLILPSTGERVPGIQLEPGDQILISPKAALDGAFCQVMHTGEELFLVADSYIIGKVVDSAPQLQAV